MEVNSNFTKPNPKSERDSVDEDNDDHLIVPALVIPQITTRTAESKKSKKENNLSKLGSLEELQSQFKNT